MKLNIVPARQGILWVKLGAQTFFRQPLAMSGLFLLFLILVMVLSIIPILGNVLAITVLPGATVGFMLASQEAFQGIFPKPAILFRAFMAGMAKTRPILQVGLGYFVAFLFLLTLTTLVDGGQFAKFFLFGGDIEDVKKMFQSHDFLLAFMLTASLNVPIALVFCHAAALVHWEGVPPIKSIFFSVVALTRNFRALLVFGLAWLGVFIAAVLAVSLLGALIGVGEDMMAAPVISGSMLLETMAFTSLYFMFRDSFDLTPGDTE
jgi:hypothetical protein